MAIEQFANNATTTLNGSINNSVTSITVSGNSAFPSSAQYRILIDNEILLVTAGTGTNSWTVSRGSEGTVATAHADGAYVKHILTKGAIAQFQKDGATIGPFNNLPSNSAGKAGMIYCPTDSDVFAIHDGSTWRRYGAICGPFTTPLASDFPTWVNQGSATVTDTNGYILLTEPATATGEQCRCRVVTPPSPPWTFTLASSLYLNPNTATNGNGGMVLRDSTSGKIQTWGLNIRIDPYRQLLMTTYEFSNATTFAGNAVGINLMASYFGSISFVRVNYDSVNYSFYYSTDFINWSLIWQVASGSVYPGTVDQVGFYLNNFTSNAGANQTSLMKIYHAAFT